MTFNDARLRRLEDLAPIQREKPAPLAVPNIIDFILEPQFLGLPRLYPRQATLLKLIFGARELLTEFDYAVIDEWSAGFRALQGRDGARYEGDYGIAPDVLDRIDRCASDGRRWFREVVLVAGRRGSKGFIGGICGAYILWNMLALGDPNRHYGVVPGKRLSCMVFAGQRQQAIANQFGDIRDRIEQAPCFEPYIAEVTRDRIALWTPHQLADGAPARAAILEVVAKEATTLSGRGPAAFAAYFDEMAHNPTASGSNRSSEEVFDSAVPATAQFGLDAFLFQASSPWHQIGKFFQNYQAALELDDDGRSVNFDSIVVQFPSGELYRDWERADALLRYPDGEELPAIDGPPIWEESDLTERLRKRDPIMFGVEHGAKWAASAWAYLTDEEVASVFAPWQGEELTQKTHGVLKHPYFVHCDPSIVGKNFGVIVAHIESDDAGTRHLVADLVHVWRPTDFDDGRIDYRVVTDGLKEIMTAFPVHRMTFDQFNSAGLIQELQSFARGSTLAYRTTVEELTATFGSNYAAAETFKNAVSLGLVHAPYHELLHDELRFLERRDRRIDHPTRGPVQTSDLADCIMALAHEALGDDSGWARIENLRAIGLRGGSPGGFGSAFEQNMYAGEFSRFTQHRPRFRHGAQRGYPRFRR